jgi:predicted MFS family arabinose efflux permease
MLALVGSGLVDGIASAVLTAAAGFSTGLAGPSRDMLIKRAAPPGATGRVYGMVYSGLDLGFALAAPVFGLLLDRGLAAGVFYGSAIALLMAVVSASAVGWRLHRQQGRASAVARAGGAA